VAVLHVQLPFEHTGPHWQLLGGGGHVQVVPLHVGWPQQEVGAVPHGEVTVSVPFAGGGHAVAPFFGVQAGYTVFVPTSPALVHIWGAAPEARTQSGTGHTTVAHWPAVMLGGDADIVPGVGQDGWQGH
jgi:hypothetical protein